MFNLPAVPGRVYFPPCVGTTLQVAADTFYAIPLVRPANFNLITEIGVRVTTGGAGATADVAFAAYHDRAGRPGRLFSTLGTASGLTGTGAAQSVLSPALNVAATPLLWLACVFRATDTIPTVAAISAASPAHFLAQALGVATMADLPNAGAFVTGVSASLSYASGFPAEAPEVTAIAGAACPLIGVKAG